MSKCDTCDGEVRWDLSCDCLSPFGAANGHATDDPNKEASDRCSNFIDDVIDVCRKHRVLINIDGMSDCSEAYFEEHSACPAGAGYILDIGDLENNVRLALWDEFHSERE